jgi:hypothetical protein
MNTRLFTLLAASGLLLVSACARHDAPREIDWAKAALARNPAYEIVATDESSGVFTVRDTVTGTVQTLRLDELVAAPATARVAAKPAETQAMAATPQADAEPVESPDVPDDTAAPAGIEQTTETVQVTHATPGQPLAEGPGYSIAKAQASAKSSAPATLEGPGYSISRDAERPAGNGEAARAPQAPASNVERRTDPIICQGNRLMHIDGDTLEFTGDAVIAEKGCDLYISNARISAGGVGIIVRQARVHIVNSTIGGTRGSYEASDGAEIYVARSTFSGIGRRFDSASMNDLGGNSYKTN